MEDSVSDKQLWLEIKQHNENALYQLFQRYYFYLVKTGITILQDPELAKDAANDIFFNIWNKRERLSEVDNIKAYLNTSYRHQASLLARRRLKENKILKEWQRTEQEPVHSYEEILVALQETEEQKEKIQRALQQLTPRQNEYLILKFYEGLSYEQIAQQTGQAIKTIYNTVYEAIKIMRQTTGFKK